MRLGCIYGYDVCNAVLVTVDMSAVKGRIELRICSLVVRQWTVSREKSQDIMGEMPALAIESSP